MEQTIKAIAIHLPQFHPIPENDLWWGKGFTEWTNVVKAKPLFEGHYQPHLPADLGFYDLRLDESRIAQAEMAKEYGIYGFCYYHYWFNGKRLLHQPLDDMIRSKKPDFPFMLCWANENWSKRWDGKDHELLMKQEYSEEDDRRHIRFLIEHFFSDPRYITIKGKPFFAVYRPQHFPDIRKTTDTWRNEAIKAGVELYLGYMQSFGLKESPEKLGFDIAIDFQPDFSDLPKAEMPSFKEKLYKKLNIQQSVHYDHKVVSYEKYVQRMLAKQSLEKNVLPSITPMWDNSARKKNNAVIFKDATPDLYAQWLKHLVQISEGLRSDERFIFINAWNEWAEGNHLEPCQKWGRKYLEITKDILTQEAGFGNEQGAYRKR